MSRVYSARLGAAVTGTGQGVLLYTVPAGVVAVVRDIRLRCEAAGAATAVQVYVHTGGLNYTIFEVKTMDADTTAQNDGRAVLEAGDTLMCRAGGNPVEFYVSGYELVTP